MTRRLYDRSASKEAIASLPKAPTEECAGCENVQHWPSGEPSHCSICHSPTYWWRHSGYGGCPKQQAVGR